MVLGFLEWTGGSGVWEGHLLSQEEEYLVEAGVAISLFWRGFLGIPAGRREEEEEEQKGLRKKREKQGLRGVAEKEEKN